MKRKYLSILLTGLMVSSAFPAAVNAADFPAPRVSEDGSLSVIYLTADLTNESNLRSIQQFEIEAAHRGWDLQVINYETPDNFRDSFGSAINLDPDVIVVGICQAYASYVDLISQARMAGIGVYSNDNAMAPGTIVNVTADNYNCGEELVTAVAEDYDWSLNLCLVDLATSEVVNARADAVRDVLGSDEHPDAVLLDTLDINSTGDLMTGGYDLTQTWLQKFDNVDLIFCGYDTCAAVSSEAIAQNGDATGENTVAIGFDGGSKAWNYIRSNTPFKYTYSQPFELFSHTVIEVIDQLQIQGLTPGDEGCIISAEGDVLTMDGIVTSVDNCPPVGASIHEVFNYYGEDPDDADAWYNWTDGPGIYTIADGAE